MSRQTIRDRDNRTLGYIEVLSDSREKAVNRDNRVLGWFDPKRNVTMGPDMRTLAKGNVLSGLIYAQR